MNSSSTNSGFFGKIGNALTGVVKTARNVVTGKKNVVNTTRKNSTIVKPVNKMNTTNASMVAANQTMPTQSGGMAPVGFQYPPNMRQPSDEIMEWATTAGLPTPITGMRNVAHGGKRKSQRHVLKKYRSIKYKISRRKGHYKKRN